VISQSQRPLPDNTQHSQNRHPCPTRGIRTVTASAQPQGSVGDFVSSRTNILCI